MTREEARKRLEVYLICAQCPEDKECYDSYLHSTCEYNDCREEVSLAEAIRTAIKTLEQEPKTGHWKIVPFNSKHGEYRPNKYACSECGWEIDLCRGLQQDTGHRLFCEHCGARMEGES